MALPATVRPFPRALIVDPALDAMVRLHHTFFRFGTHFMGDDLWWPAKLDERDIAVVKRKAVPFRDKDQGNFFLQGCESHSKMVARVSACEMVIIARQSTKVIRESNCWLGC
jgi:hypothetical protein